MDADVKVLVKKLAEIRDCGSCPVYLHAEDDPDWDSNVHPLQLAIDTLTAQADEIERLRTALEWIANSSGGYTIEAAKESARAALKAAQEVKAIESGEHLKEER